MIKDNTVKKDYVVRYVDFNTEQMWKTFEEFKQATSTYNQFKNAILEYYFDASGDFIYSLHDMDILIGERLRQGIISTKDLSEFHMQFITITNWLIEKQQLRVLEQQWAYICTFQPQLLATIMNCLQLKHLGHHLSTPYKIEDVYNAAQFVLQSSAAIRYQMVEPSEDKYTGTQNSGIKKEELSAMFAEFGKVIMEALNLSNRP